MSSPPLDLAAIASFRRVAENGSFTDAAQELGMTPSAVSRQVSRLEDNLGLQLIARTTRALRLTEAGQLFYDRCARGLGELEQAVEALGRLIGEPHGLLRVIATPCFGRLHMVPAVVGFLAAHPKMRVEISLGHAEESFLDNRAEILVRTSPVRGASVTRHKLAAFRNVVCAAPAYLQRHGRPRSPKDLARHNCLVMTQPTALQDWPFLRAGRVAVTGSFRADTMEALQRAVLAGIGIGRIPDYVVGPELRSGALIRLFADSATEATMSAYHLKTRYPDPKTQAFIAFLKTRFDASYDWERRDGRI